MDELSTRWGDVLSLLEPEDRRVVQDELESKTRDEQAAMLQEVRQLCCAQRHLLHPHVDHARSRGSRRVHCAHRARRCTIASAMASLSSPALRSLHGKPAACCFRTAAEWQRADTRDGRRGLTAAAGAPARRRAFSFRSPPSAQASSKHGGSPPGRRSSLGLTTLPTASSKFSDAKWQEAWRLIDLSDLRDHPLWLMELHDVLFSAFHELHSIFTFYCKVRLPAARERASAKGKAVRSLHGRVLTLSHTAGPAACCRARRASRARRRRATPS